MPNSVEISWLSFLHVEPEVRTPSERILVVMHGLGDTLEGWRFLPEMLKIPGLHYLLVNAPDRYFTGYSWFDIYGKEADMKKGITRSRDLLNGVLEELEAQGWVPEHVGVLGFSQGCLMAIDLACRYPKKLGAIVGISGYVGTLEEYPEKFSPVARTQKIMVTHGTMDQVLPFDQTAAQIKALQGMGLQIEWRKYDKEHTVDQRREMEDIRVFLKRHLSAEVGKKVAVPQS
jgi:phospholipase/carboxylesterase